jgi:small subunit ribosomal protein S8
MDRIGNLLTSIRNAESAGHTSVTVPHSSVSMNVLELLKKSGFVSSFEMQTDDRKRSSITISLPTPVVRHHYKRISTPARHLYSSADAIPTLLRGVGLVAVSTSHGIMSGAEAKKRSLGGELLFEAH